MRVIIVDDEPLVLRGLALRLQKFPDIEIVGQCPDGPSAVQKILELAPDLLFLDVQLPGCDGFEVLRALPPDSLPSVIFLTAFEQHAVRAFEVHALDYLLKPLDENSLAVAIQRALRLLTRSLSRVPPSESFNCSSRTRENISHVLLCGVGREFRSWM